LDRYSQHGELRVAGNVLAVGWYGVNIHSDPGLITKGFIDHNTVVRTAWPHAAGTTQGRKLLVLK
jgi:hypothetical protein